MLPNAVTSILERVTGSYIFTLRTYLLFSIFGPLGVAITIPQGEITLAQRGYWLLVGVISELALGLFMLFVSLSLSLSLSLYLSQSIVFLNSCYSRFIKE